MENRVSKVSVEEVLRKYLADALVEDIMLDIENDQIRERSDEVGMLYGEWKSRFDDDVSLVWAADSGAGFGKKGWPVYGVCDDMRIVMISKEAHKKTLHLWYDGRNDWRKSDGK